MDEDGTPPRRAAVSVDNTEKDTTCSEVKGAADSQRICQSSKSSLQNISRNSKEFLKGNNKLFCSILPVRSNDEPGCFGRGTRTHIRRDCLGSGPERNQRGGDQNNRRPEYKPPALNGKTLWQ